MRFAFVSLLSVLFFGSLLGEAQFVPAELTASGQCENDYCGGQTICVRPEGLVAPRFCLHPDLLVPGRLLYGDRVCEARVLERLVHLAMAGLVIGGLGLVFGTPMLSVFFLFISWVVTQVGAVFRRCRWAPRAAEPEPPLGVFMQELLERGVAPGPSATNVPMRRVNPKA